MGSNKTARPIYRTNSVLVNDYFHLDRKKIFIASNQNINKNKCKIEIVRFRSNWANAAMNFYSCQIWKRTGVFKMHFVCIAIAITQFMELKKKMSDWQTPNGSSIEFYTRTQKELILRFLQNADTYDCVKNKDPNALWSPDCDIDGSFKPVQCKDNGADPRYWKDIFLALLNKILNIFAPFCSCFCYSKTGKRIFGFDWIDKRDKMHCCT